MHDDLRVHETANLVAGAYAAVLHDDVGRADVKAGVTQETAQRGQQRAKLLVDRVGVQPVGHRDQHLRRTASILRGHRRRVRLAQPLASLRMRQVVVAAGRRGRRANIPRAGVANDTLVNA